MVISITLLYIVGALAMHYIVCRNCEEDVEYPSVSIACLLWPIALAIYCLLYIERFFRFIGNKF